MASNFSRADGIGPIVTFVSMIVLGIVISVYIVKNDSLQLPIILFFFFLGILLAALEMRATLGRKRRQNSGISQVKVSDKEAKDRLARYVADLFEEDIPFDDLDEDEQKNTATFQNQNNHVRPGR